ncbi:MAG: hypothetical protein JWR79_1685 [Tardiphaga sp.]|jgi:hypothetical protein|nr:hypothetical protein [Tardiphaga sp.]
MARIHQALAVLALAVAALIAPAPLAARCQHF